jgi:hypothetical protein
MIILIRNLILQYSNSNTYTHTYLNILHVYVIPLYSKYYTLLDIYIIIIIVSVAYAYRRGIGHNSLKCRQRYTNK